MSIQLLTLLGEKLKYDRYNKYIKPHTVSDEVVTILKDLDVWYKSRGDVDWEKFSDWFKLVRHATMKKEKLDVYDNIFSRLQEGEAVDADIIERFIAQDYCTQISEIGLKGAEGEAVEINDIEHLVDEWREKTDSSSSLVQYVVSEDFGSIMTSIDTSGLKWRSDFLNRSIGNLRKGKLVLFAARPNAGKTTWLATEATYMAPQLQPDEYVLWFNNEEEGSEVKYRTLQAGVQQPDPILKSSPAKWIAEYERVVGKGKVKLVDKADISVKDAEDYIREYKPGLIIFDQLWKVHGFEKGSSNDTARLQMIFQWAREMAKKHAPVVTVHQLKTEAEGQKWLTPSMLYLSGTVIQGEVDSLILMGKSHDTSLPVNDRYITIGKNKGAYGDRVDPALREGQSTWTIIPDRAMFVEK